MATDIENIQRNLQKSLEEFRQKKTPEVSNPEDVKQLIGERAEQCIKRTEDFIPPEPLNFFVKEFQDIVSEAKRKYPQNPYSTQFAETLNPFINDYFSNIKKSDPSKKIVPKKVQTLALYLAEEFDTEGTIVGKLCRLFSGEYSSHYRRPDERRKRWVSAADKLRVIAKGLFIR